MTTKKRKNEGLKALLFGVAFFLIMWVASNLYHSNIKKNGIYTIGYVYRTRWTKGGEIIYFNYFYNGEEYKADNSLDKDKKIIGKRYYVQFLPNRPKTSILLDEVPDWITEAPDGGWKTLPRDWGEKSSKPFTIDSDSLYLFGKSFDKWMRDNNPNLNNIVFPIKNPHFSLFNCDTSNGLNKYYDNKEKKK